MTIQGLSQDGKLLRLTDQQGKPIDLKTIAISRVLADKLNLGIGDTISLTNNLDGKSYSLKIGSIAEVYIMNCIYLPIDYFNELFALPKGSFIGIYSASELSIPANEVYINGKMNEVLTSYEVYSGMLGLGFLSSLMALLIEYILIALLIEDNARSIALLKILAYEPREIRKLILGTFDIPVIIGFALGIPLLFSFYSQMINSSFQEIDMTMPLRLSPGDVAIGFILLYSTYMLTRYLSSRKIFRISMVSELKTMQE